MGCRGVGATFFGIGEFTIQRCFFYLDPDYAGAADRHALVRTSLRGAVADRRGC